MTVLKYREEYCAAFLHASVKVHWSTLTIGIAYL